MDLSGQRLNAWDLSMQQEHRHQTMSMQAVYDWIDAHADECIGTSSAFVQQPSISPRTSACASARRWSAT
jgi:hypothetical protein